MKSSNRVLWSGIILFFLVIISTIFLLSYLSHNADERSAFFKDHWYHSAKETIKGSGNINSISKSLPTFSKIDTIGDYTITLRSGQSPQITITTDINLQKHLRSAVVNGELQLTVDEHFKLRPTRTIDVVITTPELQKIQLAGETHLNALNLNTPSLTVLLAGDSHATLKGEINECTLKLGGNADVDMTLTKNKTLQINSAGFTKIKLAGDTEHLTLNNGGDFSLQAENLTAKEVTINGLGQTKVRVHATDQITLNTAGETAVHYSGNPKIIKHSVGELTISKDAE